MNNTIERTKEENGLCCCICRGMGVCYLVCLASPVVLLAGVLGVAIVSLFS
jgi:hypothetical protein